MLKAEHNEVTSSSPELKMAANGPVFFLIREQAKSVVAIKDLQSRLTLLEDLQERLMQAVQNVQHHLISSKADGLTHQNREPVNSVPSTECHLHIVADTSHESDLKLESLSISNPKSDPKGESINKDSGLGSEYKDHSSDLQHSYVPYNTFDKEECKNSDDELLKLLDIIDQKSLLLLQQVEDVGYQRRASLDNQEQNEMDSSRSIENHYAESLITQRQLCEVKADRDDLKQRLSKLEVATDTVIREKKKLQRKLENVVYENHQLQTKIKSTGSISQVNSMHEGNNVNKSSLIDLEKSSIRRKFLQYSEKSRKKVAKVLKESNILELQRQLLTYIMENDVLQAKLERTEPHSISAWMKVESRLKKELKKANEDTSCLHKILLERNSEISTLENRIKELQENSDQESEVKNFGLGSNDDWREEPYRKQRGNFNSSAPLELDDFSKTQSLPVNVRFEAGSSTTATKNDQVYHFNTDAFTDVSLGGNSDREVMGYCTNHKSEVENLLDFTDYKEMPISHPNIQQQYSFYTHPAVAKDWSVPISVSCNRRSLTNHGTDERPRNEIALTSKHFSAKLVNGHLCWKRNDENLINDLDSICTEFDPLSGSPSCENFVDSLNLSIPLKPAPTTSLLSSVADSLHCASLDLGCASSAVWKRNSQKLVNACSVDGIRQLLIDPGLSSFHKSSVHPNLAQNNSITSIISGRTAHPRNLNLTDYVHSFTDQNIL